MVSQAPAWLAPDFKIARTMKRTKQADLQEIEQLATLLDSKWRIPGTSIRFGLDGVASIVPVVGDLATGLVSFYLVFRAAGLGAPSTLIWRMVANVVLDIIVGSIPVLGTVIDVFYRANMRNARLLRRFAMEQAA